MLVLEWKVERTINELNELIVVLIATKFEISNFKINFFEFINYYDG